ncbi:hypothetical protein TERTU_4625 [Teredinibacter turnerae T7901]|uniref:Uncharacterized protein n=1 Tax=Teredinibacter turnerae (strain ATCC 39867 / T7901) TaxID=377629 RepID=C5BJY1_TERTT|nr:hypothetical protein [Teredinibacter turnerae]ACR13271.1 hypothetical protein TERTU_4625 [Teredinibacter turnerae T7901]
MRQKGDVLAESLIGVLLFAVAGVGISHVAAKMSVAQRDNKVHQQVVNELRSKVQNRADSTSLCSAGGFATDNFGAEVEVAGCDLTTASVGGLAISDVSRPVVLSARLNGVDYRVGGVVQQ